MLKRFTAILAIFSVLLASCTAISNKTPTCYRKLEVPYRTPQAAQAAQNFWMAFNPPTTPRLIKCSSS